MFIAALFTIVKIWKADEWIRKMQYLYIYIKYITTIQSSNSTTAYSSNENKNTNLKDICTQMFIASQFTIAKKWKQYKLLPKDEWIKKMCYIYAMEYYSAIKKNAIMPFAATWMDLEIIILSEVSQTEKDKYHMISLMCGI